MSSCIDRNYRLTLSEHLINMSDNDDKDVVEMISLEVMMAALVVMTVRMLLSPSFFVKLEE